MGDTTKIYTQNRRKIQYNSQLKTNLIKLFKKWTIWRWVCKTQTYSSSNNIISFVTIMPSDLLRLIFGENSGNPIVEYNCSWISIIIEPINMGRSDRPSQTMWEGVPGGQPIRVLPNCKRWGVARFLYWLKRRWWGLDTTFRASLWNAWTKCPVSHGKRRPNWVSKEAVQMEVEVSEHINGD